ncbi:Bactericidal permeability-increasing protein, alpha/beta domain-containing protein [Cynara cardunculus var. scolymus]|uniref:Bactericidal permeability-increasing protein, alpha/beta domain-containing protein n=1 Tax=Cynara cardunculus var. scolymus TaxID=59895 RepID=A0A103YK69_CYNCS|nr:Bactericidal permeability-increasing protein, alpha/beta domain-containing protein [Cynara cardunculus var. scolymus]
MSTTTIYLIFIFSLFIPPHPATADQSFISLLITQNGLDFVKDLLISEAISLLTPLWLTKIERTIKIPVVGKVHIALSDITVNRVNIGSSYIKPSVTGVSIDGSEVTCELNMKWHYSYGTWLAPISISDGGTASVQVNGAGVGLTLGLDNQEGSLKLSTIESIEKAITEKLKTGVSKLGSFLQALPKRIPVDDIAALNVTFVNDPFLSDDSLGFEINGLFIESKKDTLSRRKALLPPVSCSDSSKMVGIALDEAVFVSAAALYYNAMFMHWVVDKVPEQSLLNTAGWRFIVPQLYRKYPNADMNLDISLSDPPVVQILWQNIDATVYADLIIDVLEGDETIPVAFEVIGNNLAGHLRLDDFTMSLKWSKIGTLHMFLVQPVMWTLIETVFMPYVNAQLGNGFPLPIIHGFTLQNAEIVSTDSRITVCSDVTYQESFDRSSYAS